MFSVCFIKETQGQVSRQHVVCSRKQDQGNKKHHLNIWSLSRERKRDTLWKKIELHLHWSHWAVSHHRLTNRVSCGCHLVVIYLLSLAPRHRCHLVAQHVYPFSLSLTKKQTNKKSSLSSNSVLSSSIISDLGMFINVFPSVFLFQLSCGGEFQSGPCFANCNPNITSILLLLLLLLLLLPLIIIIIIIIINSLYYFPQGNCTEWLWRCNFPVGINKVFLIDWFW